MWLGATVGEVIGMGAERTAITKGAIPTRNAHTQEYSKICGANIDETENRGTGRD